jgi:hypothetical protein
MNSKITRLGIWILLVIVCAALSLEASAQRDGNNLPGKLNSLNKALEEVYVSKENVLREMLNNNGVRYLDSLLQEVEFRSKDTGERFVAAGIVDMGEAAIPKLLDASRAALSANSPQWIVAYSRIIRQIMGDRFKNLLSELRNDGETKLAEQLEMFSLGMG